MSMLERVREEEGRMRRKQEGIFSLDDTSKKGESENNGG